MGRLAIFITLTVFVVGASCVTQDATMEDGAKGVDVVERVGDLIRGSCLFDDDKLFLRRLAHVESEDGLAPHTFRQGYNGGIWQVDREMFDKTQDVVAQITMSVYLRELKTNFKINWLRVTWEDCRKPLVSALAARLYIQGRLEGTKNTIPRDVPGQATFWTKNYRNGADKKIFEDAANSLYSGCKQIYGADIAFLLDGSGSVVRGNFEKMKKFVQDVVRTFDIGLDKSRIAVGIFAANYRTDIYFNSYTAKEPLLKKISTIRYPSGGTRTDIALDRLVTQVFSAQRGARPANGGYPRVAVILTDGKSNYPAKTLISADKVHQADITVFAVGVGAAVSLVELGAMASEPECLHMMMLKDFNEVDSLKYAISKRTCDAPVVIGPGKNKNGTEIDGKLPPGGDQNCKLKVPPEGTTIKIDATKGSATFYLSKKTFPSESYYDVMIRSQPNYPGVVFVPRSATQDAEGIVYCNIKGDKTKDTDVGIGILPGDRDACNGDPCKNGGRCVDQGATYSCECRDGFSGKNCEKSDVKQDACKPNPCKKGTCSDKGGNKFTCVCDYGWQGTYCNEAKNKCGSNPCKHGNCTTLGTGYECCCEHGWTGVHCDQDVDECSSNPCVHGTCKNRENGYICDCNPGYQGPHCDIPIDECKSNPCVNGDCEDRVNGYICRCLPGWEGVHCDKNVDECVSNPCFHGSCQDRLNYFLCLCDPGWMGPNCNINIDECSSSPCHQGTCVDGVNKYLCNCAPGWTGPNCDKDIDECISNPCRHGDCVDRVNGYNCLCHPGYTGRTCDKEINECQSNPCKNGASCDDRVDRYLCVCPDGFTGTHCETDINECDSNPCQNQGQCTDIVNGYKCHCKKGWSGYNCDCLVDNCETKPCKNGICRNALASFTCTCNTGYTGVICDTPLSTPRFTSKIIMTTPVPNKPISRFTCNKNNPCTPNNIRNGLFYHPHDNPNKFIQCDEHGGCFEMKCPTGLVWDVKAYTCNRP